MANNNNNNASAMIRNGGQAITELDGANHIQGIFYDLLACLGGGDNPNLPKDFSQKPMTGFCEILDAFNESIKLRSTGSATVCEVRSSNLNQVVSGNQVLPSSSGDTLEPKESDSQFSARSEEIRSSNSTSSFRTLTPEQIPAQYYEDEQFQGETVVRLDDYQDTYDAPENFVPSYIQTQQEKKKPGMSYIPCEELNNTNDLETNACTLQEYTVNSESFDPNHIEKVGPPLNIPQMSSTFPKQTEPDLYETIQKEMDKYSEEIKEIEKILKANITPQYNQSIMTRTSSNGPQQQSHEGETYTEGFMTPMSVLEAMCDAASIRSSHYSPSTHLSTYQSCTSFASCNDTRYHNVDGLERTPSFYMDCLNLEVEGNGDHFLKALESVNPSFVCAGAQLVDEEYEPLIIVEGNLTEHGDAVSYQNNEELMEQKIDDEGNLHKEFTSYDRVQESFHDAVDSPPSTATSSKKLKKRKKKRGNVTASSEEERLWSSASELEEFQDMD